MGLHRNYLKSSFNIDANCIDKRMGKDRGLRELELMRCIVALLKHEEPGMPRLYRLLDILGVYLYKNDTELPELNSVDGKPLFEEHPRKMLEDHIQHLIDIFTSEK